MNITRTSLLTGTVNTLWLNITDEQVRRYNAGEYVQVAFPNLTPGEREFIMTGITPTEWEETFGGGE